MVHFPEDFPLEALGILAPIIRSRQVQDKVLAGEALYTLLGYAMGQAIGTSHNVNASNPLSPQSDLNLQIGQIDQSEAEDALNSLEGKNVGAFNFKEALKNALKIASFVLPLLL